MTAISSTHLSIRRDLGSNRCPLKVSLVGVAQDSPKEVDSENAIFKLTVNDYAGKNYYFTMMIVFPCHNSRFKYLMNSVRPNESVLFIVGHLEVIQEDLYVYAADTSFVEGCTAVKRKVSGISDFQSSSGVYRSVRSRLLSARENVIEKSSRLSSVELDNRSSDLASNSSYLCHTRVEDVEDEDDFSKDINSNYSNCGQTAKHSNEYLDISDDCEGVLLNDSKRASCSYGKGNKGKEKMADPVVHNIRSQVDLSKEIKKEK
ncbi:hypothetical protein C2G38_201153 [Gigaspora rosea]|uniref:Uncharacterized protein n=1 Tax=Gigaspora rosea TaxID=44941 RepID=A0A397W336_9GLOM|nr:hypothetical protein C2G38_201153 [Gigaspora rosea]